MRLALTVNSPTVAVTGALREWKVVRQLTSE